MLSVDRSCHGQYSVNKQSTSKPARVVNMLQKLVWRRWCVCMSADALNIFTRCAVPAVVLVLQRLVPRQVVALLQRCKMQCRALLPGRRRRQLPSHNWPHCRNAWMLYKHRCDDDADAA